MPRRTRAQSKSDDLAFPIRVKIVVPPGGLMAVRPSIADWLQQNFARGCYAMHGTEALGCDAAGLHFLSVPDAQRFIDAFPQVELADGTRSASYYSPHKRSD